MPIAGLLLLAVRTVFFPMAEDTLEALAYALHTRGTALVGPTLSGLVSCMHRVFVTSDMSARMDEPGGTSCLDRFAILLCCPLAPPAGYLTVVIAPRFHRCPPPVATISEHVGFLPLPTSRRWTEQASSPAPTGQAQVTAGARSATAGAVRRGALQSSL